MKTFCAIFLLCTFAATWLSAQQTDAAAASGAIRGLEHEWVEAQSHNDNRALDLILDSAVVYVEYGQLATKADYPSANQASGSIKRRNHVGAPHSASLREHGDRDGKLSGNTTQGRCAHIHTLALRRYLGLQKPWLGAGRGWLYAH
jgi:hypothetical protein